MIQKYKAFFLCRFHGFWRKRRDGVVGWHGLWSLEIRSWSGSMKLAPERSLMRCRRAQTLAFRGRRGGGRVHGNTGGGGGGGGEGVSSAPKMTLGWCCCRRRRHRDAARRCATGWGHFYLLSLEIKQSDAVKTTTKAWVANGSKHYGRAVVVLFIL